MGAPVVSLGAHESAAGTSVIVGTNGAGASVFRGFAHGSFQQRADVSSGFVVSPAMADLNGDAIPDLVVPSYFGASFTVYLGAPDGSFTPRDTYPVAGHCTWVATGEALALYVWERIQPELPNGVTLHCVRIEESPHLYSEYRGES